MRFIFELGNKILQMVQGLRISSANPLHINEVLGGAHLNIAGLTEAMQQDVITIIQDEIKIQMATFQEDPPNPKSKPAPSTLTAVQNELKEVAGIVKNPTAFLTGALRVLPPVAFAFIAKEIAEYVFESITRPGGAMDLRWKRQMSNEFNAFLDRQTQRNAQIGTRQVVIQSQKGFLQMNGAASANNLKMVRDMGAASEELTRQITLPDHAAGLL